MPKKEAVVSDVTVAIDLEVRGTVVEGVATLDAMGDHLEAKARAVRHEDGSIDEWARHLVTARLLRDLEVALMESVHESIDRSVLNE
jgi:hypothetical protein